MNTELIKLPQRLPIAEAVRNLPDMNQALGWGVQSMVRDTVRAMVLLASSRSEHYRYALALTEGIAQLLYDMPEGATTARDAFVRCNQQGTLIGHFDSYEVHVIQEPVEEDNQGMMLLILDDDHLVDSYILTRLREYSDHVVVNKILPKKN
jgi:hypothetical protein